MTLTELKYIVAVAEERNFRRAAERCFVSQPTLSAQVRKLELAPSGDFAALLDALEEGFMPVVLKAPAAG